MAIQTFAQMAGNPAVADKGYTLAFANAGQMLSNILRWETINAQTALIRRLDSASDADTLSWGETPSTANSVLDNHRVTLGYFGVPVEVDKKMASMTAQGLVGEIAAAKVQASTRLIRTIDKKLYKGDAATAGEFNGLEVISTLESSSVNLGTDVFTSATMAKLEEAVHLANNCPGGNKIILCNYVLGHQLKGMLEAATGYMLEDRGFGQPIGVYAGYPVHIVRRDVANAEILPFTETGSTSSLYIVTLAMAEGEQGVWGLMTEPEETTENPDGAAQYKSYLRMGAALAWNHKNAVVRLYNIEAA